MRIIAASALLFTLSSPALAANDHYRNGDLLAVHWDSSYDYDDLQAMPATREILDANPGINYLVVNGTKSYRNDGIVEGSSDVMRMVFPDGLDAFHNNSNSKHQVADRWQEVLDSGGTVHVAEGGPSDFTAQVVRELRARNVGNLKNIRIVQHSQWNENHTKNTSLAYVKSATSYVKIEDGNRTNSTAWLRTSRNQVSDFKNLVSKSHHAHVWDTAFQAVTNPDRVVDFSDVVEVLEILDISKNRVADAFEFGELYFGKGAPGEPAPALPSEPVESVEPAAPSIPSQRYEPAVNQSSRIAVFGNNLKQARANYRRATSLVRVDCDPGGGGFICASFQNPTIDDIQSDSGPVDSVVPTVPTVPTVSTVPVEPGVPVVKSGRVAVYASNLAAARRAYSRATSLPRVDCDPSGSGYICASFNNPVLADIEVAPVAPEAALPTVPEEPEAAATSSVAVSGSSSFRFELEDYKLGEGWVKDTNRSAYSGSGYIRWTGGNQYNIKQAGKGVMRFSLTPDLSGQYSLRLRSRALDPAASDQNNDVWFRMTGTTWMKIFNAGKDQWIVGGKVDAGERRYVFRQDLVAGKSYTLEISGRSNGFAIDYIEMVKD